MRIRSVLKHSTQALTEGSLIALLVVGLMAGSVFAAKGGHGKPGGGDSTAGGTLAVVMVADPNGDGAPNWNDQVTFDVSTTATDKPWVKLNCYQSGTWVSTSTAGFFPAYPWAPNFTLASGGWTSGAGDCTATLYLVTSNGRSKTLATLGFHVNP
jgi:hypothetical protein